MQTSLGKTVLKQGDEFGFEIAGGHVGSKGLLKSCT
jgi:hypothetical protein